LQIINLASTLISGTLDSGFAAWSRMVQLSLAQTRISSSIGAEFATWTALTLMDVSDCAVNHVSSRLFSLPRLAALRLAGNRLEPLKECPRTNSTVTLVDLSRNNWTGVNYADAVGCYASVGGLLLENNGLIGLATRRLFVPSAVRLQSLSLANNFISVYPGYIVDGLDGNVPEVDLRGNPLGPRFSIDRPTQDQSPMTSLDLSNTDASYCYAGPFLSTSASLRVVRLRGVSSLGDTCRDPIESVPLDSRSFAFCGRNVSEAAPRSLHDVYCMVESKRVFFPTSGLTCPQWSTLASSGLLVLDVDEVIERARCPPNQRPPHATAHAQSFLRYTGCQCAQGQYWVRARLQLASLIARALRLTHSVRSCRATRTYPVRILRPKAPRSQI
jgi:hypothetical protein